MRSAAFVALRKTQYIAQIRIATTSSRRAMKAPTVSALHPGYHQAIQGEAQDVTMRSSLMGRVQLLWCDVKTLWKEGLSWNADLDRFPPPPGPAAPRPPLAGTRL